MCFRLEATVSAFGWPWALGFPTTHDHRNLRGDRGYRCWDRTVDRAFCGLRLFVPHKVREKALGAEHPDVARSLLNYAALLRKTNEKTEAKRLEVRARHILSAFPSMRWGDLTIDLKEFQTSD